MSSNGDYIAYVTATKIRVFKVDLSENEAPKIKRVDLTLKPRKIPHILHFCRHNSTDFLLTATVGLGLKCYQMSLEDDSATPIFRFDYFHILFYLKSRSLLGFNIDVWLVLNHGSSPLSGYSLL